MSYCFHKLIILIKYTINKKILTITIYYNSIKVISKAHHTEY